MLLEKMGYMISELFMLLLVLIFVLIFLRLRRGRDQGSCFTEADRNLFLRPIKMDARAPERMLRYLLIAATALPVSFLEILVLAQFGATILVGALVVTCSAIVRRGLA